VNFLRPCINLYVAARSKLCHSGVDHDVLALRRGERAVGYDSGRGEEYLSAALLAGRAKKKFSKVNALSAF
jgi:hypothetical protein